MKSFFLTYTLVAAFSFGTLTAFAQIRDDDSFIKSGDKVPSFTTERFGGGSVNIESLLGKVVLVNFWATWCPSCIQELAAVQKELLDKFKGADFVFLPISREDTPEKIESFMKAKGHKFPVYMDPDRKIYSLFATKYIPRNYLVDKTGKVVYIDKGYGPGHLENLAKQIEQLLR
jgi:peroxiredoxin